MTKNGGQYDGFLQEELNERLKLVQEALDAQKDVPASVKRIEKRLDVMQDDIKTVKYAVKDMSSTLKGHETRITALEAA